MSARLIVFDDHVADQWMPFALTRPIGDLLFGASSLASRAEAVLGLPCAGLLCDRLAAFDEAGCQPLLRSAANDGDAGTLYLCSRAVPDWSAHFEPPAKPALVRIAGESAGWWAPAGTPPPPRAFFEQPVDAAPAAAHEVDLPGHLLAHVWDLVTRNAEQIGKDWVGTARRSFASAARPRTSGPRVEVSDAPLGPVLTGGPVHIGPAAGLPYEIVGGDPKLLRVDPRNIAVEPYVLFDVSSGPIWLEQGVTIRAFTRLAGPAFVARSTSLLGGSISAVSIGPQCRIRGEVESSVILGYTNKAHDGFLGHAYLGRWVNLGALTTNSDLKNNYQPVRLWTPDGEVDTGEKKIGCFLGDHVRTAIGTMLGTGAVVGAGANVFGNGRPPRTIAPFTWGDTQDYDIERFLATAEIVMARRGAALTPALRELFRQAWKSSRPGSRAAPAP